MSEHEAMAKDLEDIEAWFVARGVPHFVESKTDGSMLDAWTRALPLLVGAYVLLGFNALDLTNWSVAQNLGAAVIVIVALVSAWAISNRLRGVATFARPTDIDAPELALFVIGPTLPVLMVGQLRDAVDNVIMALVLLALIYAWSAYGVGPLLRWAARRGSHQFAALGSLVARALPLLLLFNTFLFVNAEVWEVAGTLDGWPFVIVIVTFFLLGATFAMSRVPGVIRQVNTFETWDEVRHSLTGTPAEPLGLGQIDRHVDREFDRDADPDTESASSTPTHDPLQVRQRLNIGLVVLFGQALQITLVTVALTVFFVGFGFFAVTEATTLAWTRLDVIDAWVSADLGDRQLLLTEPLVRVAVFLGAFSGMYFTVVLTTDETYRSEFSDDLAPEIREALAVRTAYRMARCTHPLSTNNEVPRA